MKQIVVIESVSELLERRKSDCKTWEVGVLEEVCSILYKEKQLTGLSCRLVKRAKGLSHTNRLSALLQSHLRLPQPGGPGPRVYILPEQGGLIIPPALG
jgi:hypothetical protein